VKIHTQTDKTDFIICPNCIAMGQIKMTQRQFITVIENLNHRKTHHIYSIHL